MTALMQDWSWTAASYLARLGNHYGTVLEFVPIVFQGFDTRVGLFTDPLVAD